MHFTIPDVIPPVEGVDLGGRWNGARRPTFRKESADAIVDHHNAYHHEHKGPGPGDTCAWYDEVTRDYVFYHPDSGETERVERVFSAMHMADVWPIGCDGWTWQEAPTTKVTLTFTIVGPTPEEAEEFFDGLLENGVIQGMAEIDCGADGLPWSVVDSGVLSAEEA